MRVPVGHVLKALGHIGVLRDRANDAYQHEDLMPINDARFEFDSAPEEYFRVGPTTLMAEEKEVTTRIVSKGVVGAVHQNEREQHREERWKRLRLVDIVNARNRSSDRKQTSSAIRMRHNYTKPRPIRYIRRARSVIPDVQMRRSTVRS
jgi:hypothetical protein